MPEQENSLKGIGSKVGSGLLVMAIIEIGRWSVLKGLSKLDDYLKNRKNNLKEGVAS